MRIELGSQKCEWDLALGGRLTSWKVDDLELLAHHSDLPIHYGMYSMVPWTGRLWNNTLRASELARMGIDANADYIPDVNYLAWGIHGTCAESPVDEWDTGENFLHTRQRIPRWPWQAFVDTTWELVPEGLEVTLSVTSDEACPAVVGWHPWFPKNLRGAHAQWSARRGRMASRVGAFPSEPWIDLDQALGPFDNSFEIPDREVDIIWPGVLGLRVESSHPWFVIFDELPDALCVEPQSQIPNAWQSPLAGEAQCVKPGAPLTLTTRWVWTRLDS